MPCRVDDHGHDHRPATPDTPDTTVEVSATVRPPAFPGDASATTVPKDRRVRAAGLLLALLGATGVLGSGFLPWLDRTVSRGRFQVTRTTTGTGVPVQFLWDFTARRHDPSLLAVLVPIVAIAVLGVVIRHGRGVALVAGAAAVCVSGLYAFQENRMIDDVRSRLGGLVNPELRDVLGVAPVVCFAGGAAIVLGSLVTLRRRRTTDASRSAGGPSRACPRTDRRTRSRPTRSRLMRTFR
jgi:hypothetical protein